jgi:hypothetical protein
MHPSDSYTEGYINGYANAQYSGQYALDHYHYVPTADERAQSINFRGNDGLRRGWLVGWRISIAEARAIQADQTRKSTRIVLTD